MKQLRQIVGYLVAPLSLVAWHGSASAQRSPETLTIGTARTVTASGEEQRFPLRLEAGQGIIVDLTPLVPADGFEVEADVAAEALDLESVVDAAAEAVDAAAEYDGAEYVDTTPTIALFDPAQACVRAVPARDGCASAGLAATIEYQVGDSASRLALSPASSGRYTLVLTIPPGGSSERYELLVRERDLPKPVVPKTIALCRAEPVVAGKGQGAPQEDPCAETNRMSRAGRSYFVFETTTRDQWVQIDMTSAKFDGLVTLAGPLGDGLVEDALSIAADDDSGGSLNPRLRQRLLDAGRYVVIAESLYGDSGEFTLAVRALPRPEERPAEALRLGVPRPDTFSDTELIPYHRYTLEVEPGQSILVEMTSPGLDTTLDVGIETRVFDETSQLGNSFASLAANEDSCGITDSRIRLRFEERRLVTIRAGAHGLPGTGGQYTIVARPAAGFSCPEYVDAAVLSEGF